MTSEVTHRESERRSVVLPLSLFLLVLPGCAWPMLAESALHDPIAAVAGDGAQIYVASDFQPPDANVLERSSDAELLAYYSPVIVQQFKARSDHGYAYEREVDLFGTPYLERLPNGRLQTRIDSGSPAIYGIFQRRILGERPHVQLTYTFWYRRHPRTKTFDIEPGLVDSGVVRITLDDTNRPLIYETVLACGCYHKVFVERRLEEAAKAHFGEPVGRQKYSIGKSIPFKFDFEVAGLVDSPVDAPARPVVFISSGEHKVLGLHSSAEMNWPDDSAIVPYRLADYQELTSVPVVNEGTMHSLFNAANDRQVYGGQRMERFIFALIGTDDAGHPRHNDEILLHFDQSRWMDPQLFNKYLRIPPGSM